jgi:ATP-dependent exoDNAse (exonuclease V) alpha subunit
MDYKNLKEANEIDFAINYIREIRSKFIDEIRAKEKELGEGVITVVVRNFANGIIDIENEEIERLRDRISEL